MLVVMPSGSWYCFDDQCGIYFWGAHEHDGIWHLALIETAFKQIPFQFPVLAGKALGGYNYLLDIVLFVISKLGVPASLLYFKIQPVAWFATFCILLYHMGRSLHDDKRFVRLLFFFVFFSSSFGIFIQLLKHHTLTGSMGIPTMQGALSMTNPQFMWSLCVLLALWIFTTKDKWPGIVGLLIFAGLGLKFYFIVPAVIMVGWYLVRCILNRNIKSFMVALASTGAGVVMAYVIFYSGGTPGGLVWKPLEITHQMVEDKNLWYDQVMVQERYFIQQLGNFWSPRLWFIEVKTIFYFIFFNFGIRMLGVLGILVLTLFGRGKYTKSILILLIVVMSTVMPILYIQRGTWWNTIQFLYYAIFFASILNAEFIWYATRRTNRNILFVVCAVCALLFLPSTLDILQLSLSSNSVRYIPDEEVYALQKLRSLPKGVVLTQSFQKQETNILADNYDTAYVSAYSGKPVYVADKDQLQLLGAEYGVRSKKLSDDPCSALPEVEYVYVRLNTQDQKVSRCDELSKEFTLFYQNNMVLLWRKE